MNEPLERLPGWARELIERAPVARLGLLDDDDRPRVLPITFALLDGAVWTAIDRKPKRTRSRPPARIRYLQRMPAAAVTIDRYEDDWSQLAWVQLLGRATVLAAADAPTALEALASRYEQYRREAPPGPLIRIAVERTLSWRAE